MDDNNMRRVFSAGPSISALEIQYATDAVTNGWFENRNSYIDRFTDHFAEYLGVKYVLPVAHCTDAIHLALLALGVGPGDEVIVPNLTWVASAAPVKYVGAKLVFSDVDPGSWCMTLDALKTCVTENTKAVVVVDLLGNMPDWAPIVDFCRANEIFIIEDAAEAIGATYGGLPAGRFGDISVFSFNATKLLMAGQGGAFCTDNEELYRIARRRSHHGIDIEESGKYFWSNELGYNYNWTNVQASIALAQLERISELLNHKRWLYEIYSEHLFHEANLQLNPQPTPEITPSYWVPSVIFKGADFPGKEVILKRGAEFAIDLRPMFYCLDSMPTFLENQLPSKVSTRNARFIAERGICLPSGNELVEEDILHVVEFVKSVS